MLEEKEKGTDNKTAWNNHNQKYNFQFPFRIKMDARI